jgi:hypothetical protein
MMKRVLALRPVCVGPRQPDFLTPAPAGCYRLQVAGSTMKIMVHRTPFREITRQHTPLAATFEEIQQHAAKDLIEVENGV